MNYDMLTTAAMRDELNAFALHGRVQSVVQPGDLELGLEVYAGERRYLLLNAEADAAGVWLMDEKPRRGVEQPTPMLLLLRKYLEGARLVAIEQPPLERILRLHLAGAEGAVQLVCEIMGRLSNVILLDEQGVIMDALKRVPASLNRYRTILPHQPYVPPPAQDKEHPLALSQERARAILGAGEGPLWRALVAGVAGISPTLAREIAQRATGSATSALPLDGAALDVILATLDALMRLPETHGWQPSVGLSDGEDRSPLAYAPYLLTHCAAYEPMPTISAAIQRVRAARVPYDGYARARARLHGLIREAMGRDEARLEALRRSMAAAEEALALQVQGNAILASSWAIALGQRELVVNPVALGLRAEGSRELRIALDPALTPAENAQALFRRYRKLQAATEQVPGLLAEAEMALAYWRQLAAEVELAEDRQQLDQVERELGAILHPEVEARRRPAPRSAPLRITLDEGDVILVGRNSAENHEVTFRRAAPSDIWLHAHVVPGSHVILKSAGAVPTEGALRAAAQLAAYYSAARGEAHVLVDYTERRHVRAIKGGRPGMVTYAQEQTLTVAPAPTAALNVEAQRLLDA